MGSGASGASGSSSSGLPQTPSTVGSSGDFAGLGGIPEDGGFGGMKGPVLGVGAKVVQTPDQEVQVPLTGTKSAKGRGR